MTYKVNFFEKLAWFHKTLILKKKEFLYEFWFIVQMLAEPVNSDYSCAWTALWIETLKEKKKTTLSSWYSHFMKLLIPCVLKNLNLNKVWSFWGCHSVKSDISGGSGFAKFSFILMCLLKFYRTLYLCKEKLVFVTTSNIKLFVFMALGVNKF